MPKTRDLVKSGKKLLSDFWMGDHEVPDLEPSELVGGFDFSRNGRFEGKFKQSVIELASARRAIGNFVSILTNKDIPVRFAESGAPGCTDGKCVYLSTSISKRSDFDWGVGLALHEGSHILLTDMEYFRHLAKKIPTNLYKKSKEKNLGESQFVMFAKFIFNYVEDRFIDTYIFDTAPGYRGYYTALYNKFFHSKEIADGLKSKGWRIPTLTSYEFRIVNLINKTSDLTALPGLKEIAEMIDIQNIRRLKETPDRFDLAMKILEKVLTHLDKSEQTKENNAMKKISEDIAKALHGDIIGGEDSGQSSYDIQDIGNHGFSPKQLKKILKAIEKQRRFLLGQIDKKEITEEEKKLLSAVEEAGIHVVQIQNKLIGNGIPKVNCFVVKKLTKSLLESGIIPMAKTYGGSLNRPEFEMTAAVRRGIVLGTMLGRKLMVRREVNHTKFPRLRTGKIDRRVLAGIGAGLEDIFYNIKTDKFGKASLHISVDSSSSMNSSVKWHPTITCVVAICKAASMIPNLRVSVSFRASQTMNGNEAPYIIMAYDSAVDKFEKVKLLFPYLSPHGCTPEGLAMEATIKTFISKTQDGSEYFFLNLSDGEPYYHQSDVNYCGDIATNHTKHIINRLRNAGFRILSYFISDNNGDTTWNGSSLQNQFKTMYGKDARFINVTSVFDVAKTMNHMFLQK